MVEIVAAMEGLKPGDVVLVPARKPGGARFDDRVAVLSTTERKRGDLTLRAITAGRRLVLLGPRDFRSPPHVVGRLALPTPFAPKNRDFQRRVAASLAASGETSEGGPGRGSGGRGAEVAGLGGDAAGRLAVARCPGLRAHLRAAARAERLGREVERLERQVLGRTESLARQFDRVLQLLERWCYVEGWSLTPAGTRLARIYHEQDLLVAECAERGILDGLRPAEMAGLVSVFTYEARAHWRPRQAYGDGRVGVWKSDGAPCRLWPGSWPRRKRPGGCQPRGRPIRALQRWLTVGRKGRN